MQVPYSIVRILATSLVAGGVGVVAMQVVMRLIARAEWAKGDMIVAIGSLLTRSRENAFPVGCLVHGISAVVFAALYGLGLRQFGMMAFPSALFVCIGFSILHGLVVSLMLVWIVAEQHPLEEFNEAGFAVGLTHFAGHVAYGAGVGLVFAVSTLL